MKFSKFSGNGNDFIIFDNRSHIFDNLQNEKFIQKISERGLSVGADGVIFVENSDKADFKWKFFNSDGTIPDMCGNGARAVARFASLNNIVASNKFTFETVAGIIEAEIKDDTIVKVELTKPHSMKVDEVVEGRTLSTINTGVPHAVIIVDDITKVDIKKEGSFLRYHSHFAPKGTNVNFIQIIDSKNIAIRTYERGVEDETLACGTGATASALIAIQKGLASSPVNMVTRSKKILTIYSEKNGKVYLEGEARHIFTAELDSEGYNY